jgi:ring-1,2-phenylacetyl-CoA epoxidase subunit PaaE
MSQFHKLTIADIKNETPDTVSVAFHLNDEQKTQFKYLSGQYLTLAFVINGNELRRSYSLCSSFYSNELIRVAVKKVENGIVSTYINEQLKVGDVVDVMPPQGNFVLDVSADNSKSYVAFAAGSGITPIMSMIKSVISEEPSSQFHLFYGNKDADNTIFKSDIDGLLNSNLKVTYVYSRDSNVQDLYYGRLNAEKVNLLLRSNLDCLKADAFFLCGPEQMIFDTTNTLKSLGIADNKIHFELFTTPVLLMGDKKDIQVEQDEDFDGDSVVTVICDDEEFEFELSADGDTILDAAMDNDADVPFSCKGAVCCTCKAKVLEGKVTMDANYALSDKEVEDGFVLSCQSHPASSSVKLDFDL